jgi:hypothetical protein
LSLEIFHFTNSVKPLIGFFLLQNLFTFWGQKVFGGKNILKVFSRKKKFCPPKVTKFCSEKKSYHAKKISPNNKLGLGVFHFFTFV